MSLPCLRGDDKIHITNKNLGTNITDSHQPNLLEHTIHEFETNLVFCVALARGFLLARLLQTNGNESSTTLGLIASLKIQPCFRL